MSEPPAPVSLRPVTEVNFNEVIRLSVRDDQKHFVASNAYSLAEAHVFPGRYPLAIYAGDTPVGFAMYVDWNERQPHEYWIFRLMIAAGQQGRGYGRAAMRLLVEQMRATLPGCRRIYISYEPENEVARKLYASLGFVTRGERLSGEEVAWLDLA
jgi:diamine N-acetyltransferase